MSDELILVGIGALALIVIYEMVQGSGSESDGSAPTPIIEANPAAPTSQSGGSTQNTAAVGSSSSVPQAGGSHQTAPAATTNGPAYNPNSLSQQTASIQKIYGDNSIVSTSTNGDPLITTYTSGGQSFQAARSPANASEAAAADAANEAYISQFFK